MAEEKAQKPQPKLIELVTPDTREPELKEIVSQFITPEDEEVLGGKEEAIQKVADGVAYLGPFAPAPATFDAQAFNRTAAFGLPEEQQKKLLELCKKMGVIDDIKDQPGRMSVSKEIVEAAKNQFLTKD